MGKRSEEKGKKKEQRQAEAAALAKSAWLSQAAGPRASDARSWSVKSRGAATRQRAAVGSQLPASHDGVADPEMVVASDAVARPALDGALDGATSGPRREVDASELAAQVASLGTLLQRQLARGDTGDGLTRARLSALAPLVLGGPRTLGDLAAAEHVRPPTMTRLVHAMEADGLVSREPHPSDRRSIIIRATPEGETLLERGHARRTATLAESIMGLDAAERARLAEGIDLLARVVRAAGRDPGEPPG